MLVGCWVHVFIEVIRLVAATPEAGSPANVEASSSCMEFPASALAELETSKYHLQIFNPPNPLNPLNL